MQSTTNRITIHTPAAIISFELDHIRTPSLQWDCQGTRSHQISTPCGYKRHNMTHTIYNNGCIPLCAISVRIMDPDCCGSCAIARNVWEREGATGRTANITYGARSRAFCARLNNCTISKYVAARFSFRGCLAGPRRPGSRRDGKDPVYFVVLVIVSNNG